MFELLSFFVSLFVSTADVERLQRVAYMSPEHVSLTSDSARAHLGAATLAEAIFDEPREALLAITLGESNFDPKIIFVEKSGSLSCGVMQASARSRLECELFRTLTVGYLAGAYQLRKWHDEPTCKGSLACSLAGYAAGWNGLKWCRSRTNGACWKAVGERLKLMQSIRGEKDVGQISRGPSS